ncbi:MAG: DUF4159 domain-containing protein [Acidobacteria bacterium]|nr:DUF4159 domain-containing protein [Planctomycetota bacterium]MBE3132984.1 DUF4159 domain-containing protein [Acidobacteriota bacterium]
MRRMVWLSLIAGLLATAAPGAAPPAAITDEEVLQAIEKAQEYLVGLQGGGGAWPEQRQPFATADYGHTEMVMYTLVYTGVHPNRDAITKGLEALLTRQLDYTYAIAMRTMAYAHVQKKLAGKKRDLVRKALLIDANWLVQAQGSHGGWDYTSLNGSQGRYDLSNTQMAILALREAALAGIEIPRVVWERNHALYLKEQKQDGAWNYGSPASGTNDHLGGNAAGYGTMTAAGLASIFITMDNLDLASGCPCRGGRSTQSRGDFDRRVDAALKWLQDNFKPDSNPKGPDGPDAHKFYWLYSVERVGIAAGYKYFGTHNWFREGAEYLLKTQQPNGSWGGIPDTCFALLFLYKGRAPVLYNKLEFKGEWNSHRRDTANLTTYIEKIKEQIFHWQIVSLKAPVEELHDAPILYITPESVPEFSDEHKQKLRQFTDTGGTILFEASCGNPAVRKWVQAFTKEIWPEWSLKPLGPEHGSFMDPNPLKQRPEILGLHDGVRTFVFYSMDDISCPWQTKAYTGRDYLFKWGINLFTYATDHSPLRAKLAKRQADKPDERYKTPLKAGPRSNLTVARVKYEGTDWLTGRNYKVFDRLKDEVAKKASVNLTVDESGLEPSKLGSANVAFLIGSGAIGMSDAEKQALKAYAEKGGFLWVEAAGGSIDFNAQFLKLAEGLGWQVKLIPQTDGLLTGRLPSGAGYSLISGVRFRRSLRVQRLGRPNAEVFGLYADSKLVGLYSAFDVLFSMTGLDAYGCRGYQPADARAVATNIVLYLTDRPAS